MSSLKPTAANHHYPHLLPQPPLPTTSTHNHQNHKQKQTQNKITNPNPNPNPNLNSNPKTNHKTHTHPPSTTIGPPQKIIKQIPTTTGLPQTKPNHKPTKICPNQNPRYEITQNGKSITHTTIA